MHCGRLSPEKRPQDSVQALAGLLDRGVRARLVVAGTGPREEHVRRLADGLPVTFLGHVSRRGRLPEVLASADVAIAPGPHETFGLAAMEAMACGTPVVVSSRSALPELIGAGGIAGEGPQEFCAAIGSMLPGLPSWRRSARAVAEAYPWELTVSRMLALHGQLLQPGGLPDRVTTGSAAG